MVFDNKHDLVDFPHLTKQIKSATSKRNAKPQSLFPDGSPTKTTKTTKTVTAFVDHPLKWHTTVSVTPTDKFTQTVSVLVSHSVVSINDNCAAVRVSNTTASPYTFKKNKVLPSFP